MYKIVFLDLETDRLDTTTAEPIQIACIAVDRATLEEIAMIEMKILFDVDVADKAALAHNNYDSLVWGTQAVSPRSAVERLRRFFGDHSTWQRQTKKGHWYTTCEMAGHNIAQFDAPVLANWFKRNRSYNPTATWATGPVDTMHMARSIEFAHNDRWGHFNLAALCKRFDIELTNAHDALADVRATVELAKQLKHYIK